MNKKIKSLLIVTALVLPVLAATAATAGPDCGDPKFANHHLCAPPTPSTTTTTEPPVAQSCATVTKLSGTGNLELGCDWTPRDDGAAIGTVTVSVTEGEVSRVVVFVRDSAPGDICVLKEWDKAAGTVFEASFPLVDKPGTYWGNATNWCEPFDPVIGQRTDLNGSPLHVFVSVRAKKGTVVEVALSPGQAE